MTAQLIDYILKTFPSHGSPVTIYIAQFHFWLTSLCACISNCFLSSTVSGLSLSDLTTVFNHTLPCRARWYILGLRLRMDVRTLDSFRVKYSDPVDLLMQVLKTWLTTSENPTWEAMVEALKSPVIGEARLAMELQQKFCSNAQPPVDGE